MTLRTLFSAALGPVFLAAALGAAEPPPAESKPGAAPKKMEKKRETATLGAGCYWCIEAVLQRIKGVEKLTSGFMGGHLKNPTYERVCDGDTGHAEVVQVEFDPAVLSYPKLLDVFWIAHDPTTLNRQGHDVGPQYRSAIFYHSDAQKAAAEKSKAAAQPEFDRPIVTEISPASEFYAAPAYHQNYYNLNRSKNPYCRAVIGPKLRKLGLEKE